MCVKACTLLLMESWINIVINFIWRGTESLDTFLLRMKNVLRSDVHAKYIYMGLPFHYPSAPPWCCSFPQSEEESPRKGSRNYEIPLDRFRRDRMLTPSAPSFSCNISLTAACDNHYLYMGVPEVRLVSPATCFGVYLQCVCKEPLNVSVQQGEWFPEVLGKSPQCVSGVLAACFLGSHRSELGVPRVQYHRFGGGAGKPQSPIPEWRGGVKFMYTVEVPLRCTIHNSEAVNI